MWDVEKYESYNSAYTTITQEGIVTVSADENGHIPSEIGIYARSTIDESVEGLCVVTEISDAE